MTVTPQEFWEGGHDGYPRTYINWGSGALFGHIDVTHWKNGNRENLPYDLREKEIELANEIRKMLVERTRTDAAFAELVGLNLDVQSYGVDR